MAGEPSIADGDGALSSVALVAAAAGAVLGVVWVVRIAAGGADGSIVLSLLSPLVLIYVSVWYLRRSLGDE